MKGRSRRTRVQKELYETTDYVICAEHRFTGSFELGCWMCGFEDFLYRMALDEEWIHRFLNVCWNTRRRSSSGITRQWGRTSTTRPAGTIFATQNAPFVSPDMFRELVKAVFQGAHRLYQAFYKGEIPAPFLRKRIQADRRPGGLRR